MPHIDVGNDAPGITSLFIYRPDTARPLSEPAERGFCASSHAYAAGAERIVTDGYVAGMA